MHTTKVIYIKDKLKIIWKERKPMMTSQTTHGEVCFCAKEGFILPTQLPLIEAINYGVGKTERVLYT